MQPIPPVNRCLHVFATRLAYRLAGIVEPCLTDGEIQPVIAEFYRAITEDMHRYRHERKMRRA